MTARRSPFVVAMVVALLVAIPLALGAADQFSDVGDSNVHREDIAWLRGSGITLGCNPPANTEFCPGQPVLRQQMASFLRRLAESETVKAATAKNADRVDGRNANELGRIAHVTADGNERVISDIHLSTSITAPTAGFLTITYTGAVVGNDRSTDIWGCMIGVDGVFPDEGTGYGSSGTSFLLEGCTAHLVVGVEAGNHQVDVAVERFFETAEFGAGTLSAQFVPFDGSGRLATLSGSGSDPDLDEQLDRFRKRVAELTSSG